MTTRSVKLPHSIDGAIYNQFVPIVINTGKASSLVLNFNGVVLKKTLIWVKNNTEITPTGVSELVSYDNNMPAVLVDKDNTLTIRDIDNQNTTNATMSVVGGDGAAAIGGKPDTEAGNIVINSLRVIASTKNGGSAIGGGKNGKIGSVTISGGTVFASHTGDGYDIGSGQGAEATPIYITGGSVKATSFNGNPTNGSAQVYRVTIGDLAPNKAISVTGLNNYGTNSIYSDEEGKIYLWLPNGAYNIHADDKHYTVVVKDNDGVLMPYHAGTAEDPFLISNTAEWDVFATFVNSGNTTAFGRLTNNVGPVQTMVGTESNPYAGTFDGNGYTLTLNISKPHNYAAPFSYVSGATIQNLFTAGTIEYTGQFAGGIIGLVGTNPATLTTCGSSARINFVNSGGGDTSTGGLVGGGVVTMSNCVFTGTLAGTTGKCRGGLMGWANAGTTITNCLQLGNFEVSADNSCTIVRGSNGVSINNCYYKNILGDTQGTQVTDAQLASGEVAYLLQGNATTTAWGQNIGTESYPVPTTDANYRVRKATFTINNKSVGTTYAAKSGEFSAPDVDVDYATTNPEDFYTMTDKDVNVEIQVWDKDADGYFAINDRNDWDNLDALKYYDGVANFRLKADIDSITTMVGTDAAPFKGIFDGDGHTLTIDLTGTTQFTAPFSRVENATIKNLKVAGKLYQSGKGTNIYHASGLVGRANGVTLDRCVSSVALSFNDQGDAHSGGLVGHATTSTIKVSDCAFIGNFSEQAGRNNASVGGIVGWGETSCKVDIKNSYVDLSSLTNIPGQNNLVRAKEGWTTTGSTFSNCFYTVPAGVRDWDAEPATLVTKEQMKSGEVAYKLQAAHTTDGNVWGQKIGTDADPVLNSSDKVYTVAFTINNKAVNRYANNGGKVTLPTYAEFRSVLGNDFDNGKYTDNTLTFPGFDANTIVTADRTVVCQTNAKDFFDIASVSDWNKLATAVSEGQTRINARLTTDVSGVNTTIGSAANPYRGTFDGQRHTLNVNLSASTEELAPFSRTDGATIKNLTVSGSITSDKKYAGSIVGRAYNTTLNDVLGTATIKFTGTDDATYGGLIGVCSPNNGTTTLNNTAFTGTLDVANGNSIGGLVGWTEGNLNISNSLVAATINVQAASKANAGENNCALARRNDKVTATNCYVRSFNNMQTPQGTVITDEQLRNGSVAHDLQINQNEMHWGQTLNTDNQPRLSTDAKDQVFRVEFDYAATVNKDILATQFINRGNTAKALAFNTIKPHISNYDAHQYYKINYEDFDFGKKIEQDYTVPTNYTSVKTFEINDANDWQTFANAVAEGQNYINAELKSDISGVTAMVGTQQAPYGGKFYGGYHTLTVDLTSNQQFCAPFQQVKYAEINNLRTAGTVTASAYHASGLVGRADWVHIHNCEVGVNIRFKKGYQGDDVHSGGFVGHGADNEIVIDKCAFNGSFSAADGQSFYGVGGFIGWGGRNATIKNSYVHTPKGTGCQSYYPFIYRSDGLYQSTLIDCFVADYGDEGIKFDQYNEPCAKFTPQQVENGYATYAMQQRIPEIDTQVEPVWGQKMDGTDKMPHVVGDNSDMKVVRNMFSANDSIYDNYFVVDENKDNIYNIKENYNSRFINYNLKLKRKFAPGWNTLVLPIKTSYEELVEKLGAGTKVATFNNESENTIRLDTIATDDSYQELYNNEPFLVYTQTQDSVFTFDGRMISTTEYPAKYGSYGINFIGSYADSYTVQPDEYFISGKCLWKSDGNTIIKGTRAFFRADNQSAGSNIYLVWGDDDDPTAIKDATTDNASSTLSGPVYNLNGQKVGENINDMPKGIYIVNGKKIKK